MNVDYSSFGLQDKVAIVTGASQGIGRAIALGLAQAGAHVVLAKHPEGRQDEARQLQAEIEGTGQKGDRSPDRCGGASTTCAGWSTRPGRPSDASIFW